MPLTAGKNDGTNLEDFDCRDFEKLLMFFSTSFISYCRVQKMKQDVNGSKFGNLLKPVRAKAA